MRLFKPKPKTPTIQFLCEPEDEGVIPAPYPARKLIPDWYRHLPQRIDNLTKLENSTVKRCAPVLDAFCMGWIIPLAADVEFCSNEDASGVTWKTNYYREIISTHAPQQVSSNTAPHPELPKPPLKWLNYWHIKLAPGYSALFTPPLNRADHRFECFSGVVDAGYEEFINFPFWFKQPNYTGIIKQGTPLVQVIVVKKEQFEEQVRVMTPEDREAMDLTRRRRKAHESLYRDVIWRPVK
jgi:hypothetical protein